MRSLQMSKSPDLERHGSDGAVWRSSMVTRQRRAKLNARKESDEGIYATKLWRELRRGLPLLREAPWRKDHHDDESESGAKRQRERRKSDHPCADEHWRYSIDRKRCAANGISENQKRLPLPFC